MKIVLSLCFLALGAAGRAQPAAAWPDKPVPSTTRRVAVLEDKRLNESSGLCRSSRGPGIFWTINDSGGEPCVFAIDQNGRTRAKVRVREAANFDWEDMDLGKDDQGAPCLFVADIGDNLLIRPSIQVYQFPEPPISAPGSVVDETESSVPQLWRASYPDGRHDAESLLVHPVSGRIFIITKSEKGICALYGFPQPLQSGASMILEKVADFVFPEIHREGKRPRDNCKTTAASFSPDGSRLVVATYSSLYEWDLSGAGPLQEALKRPPVRLEPERVAQMEGACYDADGSTLWYSSEGLPTPLMKVSRP